MPTKITAYVILQCQQLDSAPLYFQKIQFGPPKSVFRKIPGGFSLFLVYTSVQESCTHRFSKNDISGCFEVPIQDLGVLYTS